MHGLLLIFASVALAALAAGMTLTKEEEAFIENQLDLLERRQVAATCEDDAVTTTKYRRANGKCNNLEHPKWGRAGLQFKRKGQNTYADGTNMPRKNGKNGAALPSPRKVSTKVHYYDATVPLDNKWTVMFMQWGQFLDHDLTATPLGDDSKDTCCTAEVLAGAEHPDVATGGNCFPIVVPDDDSHFETNCLNFKRSKNVGTGEREQENAITAFVDGSQVYGSSKEEQSALRSFVNGQMLVSAGENLPDSNNTDDCFIEQDGDFCFLAGDERVNVFPGLSTMHTIMVRFHNQLATKFAEATEFTDEQIFQETRKIVSAVLQHITFTEYLPEVLGLTEWEKYNLHDVDYNYDITVNPSIANEFATAAFRFGHSTIVKSLRVNNIDVLTEDLFLRPYFTINFLRSIVESLIRHRSELSDRYMVEAITNNLFLKDGISSDLIALNINRGRDHGLPTYNDIRESYCGLSRVANFDSSEFRDYGSLLAEVYDDVDDIDLFTGGIAEAPVASGGTLGATFSCIIGKQFEALKFGDSFWYETKDATRGFNAAQIAEIKKIFLARILCDTVHEFESIQPFVFVPRAVAGNEGVNCSQISNFNFDVFLNTTPGDQQGEARPGLGAGRPRINLNRRPEPPADTPTAKRGDFPTPIIPKVTNPPPPPPPKA